jgi:phosphoglycolate phosphatase
VNRLAIFDCDGTLVDSGATIFDALAESFAMHGRTAPSADQSRRVIGLSLVEAMAALAPEAEGREHRELSETYKHCFSQARQAGRVREPLFAGIAEVIDTLEANGWLLAVATGKSDRGLNFCLDEHNMRARFVSLQTADRHPSKPHPSMVEAAIADAGAAPETTVVIGDTVFDIEMARAAGAAAIGVGWGNHDGAELLAAGALAVADDPGALVDLIESAVR